MPVRSGIISGVIPGIQSSILANPNVASSVPRDGPANVAVPQSGSDWNALGLPAPTHQWLGQEASGNLADSVGAIALVAGGTPLYQQAVAGWTRVFTGLTAAAANMRFNTTDAGVEFALNESFAWLHYGSLAAGAANQIFSIYGSNSWRIEVGTTGLLRCFFANVLTTGAANHSGIGTIRPILYGRNGTALFVRVITNLETITGTLSLLAATGGSAKGLGATSGNVCAARQGPTWFWRGADAETILQASTLTTLGW